jgi:hypothetical protein
MAATFSEKGDRGAPWRRKESLLKAKTYGKERYLTSTFDNAERRRWRGKPLLQKCLTDSIRAEYEVFSVILTIKRGYLDFCGISV